MINARAETLTEKPSFRKLIKSNRCIIISDGYYEWKTTGRGKQPYYIHHPNNEIIPFAGLWDQWIDEKQKEWLTFTIITTHSKGELRHIHHRMPIIINDHDIDQWIDTKSKDVKAFELIKPYENELEYYTVSKFVNSYTNNDSECIKPIKINCE